MVAPAVEVVVVVVVVVEVVVVVDVEVEVDVVPVSRPSSDDAAHRSGTAARIAHDRVAMRQVRRHRQVCRAIRGPG